MAQDTPSRKLDQYIVRMPDGMRDRIREAAEESGRSMNAEIVSRLALTLEENVWERQKFIDLLNFKQHIIDKQMHVLFSHVQARRRAEDAASYQAELALIVTEFTRMLCRDILNEKGVSAVLRENASRFLDASQHHLVYKDDSKEVEASVAAEIGDKDDVGPDWEERLSLQDRARLREARQLYTPHS